jgi:hypothetical protein
MTRGDLMEFVSTTNSKKVFMRLSTTLENVAHEKISLK